MHQAPRLKIPQMSSTDIDDDIAADEETPEAPSWLPSGGPEPIPAGDARRRLERYWELKRLKQEVDDFTDAEDVSWDDL